jgi:exodeoxyribonuclease V alpha subunit
MAKIRCVPTHKIWKDDNNEFKIYAIDVKESNVELEFNKYGNITVSGVCSDFDIGEEYTLTITKSESGKYKGSYELRSIKRLLPTNREDKFTFLSFIISDKQSNELLDTYPDIIQMIIDDNTETIDVNKLYGIGDVTLEKIVDKVNDNFVLIDLVSKFSHYGLTHREIKRLHAKYKNTEKLIFKMENEPYPVLCSISGIGFKKADKRILTGKPEMRDSNQRLIEAIKYIIFNSDGDSAITLKSMYKKLSDLDNSLRIMMKDIVDNDDYELLDGIKSYGDVITTNRLFEKAKYIFVKLLKLSKGKNIFKYDVNLEDYRVADGINVTDEQLNILKIMNENNFGVLVGSAGSGKTTAMDTFLNMLDANNATYELCAFTGAASKVLSNHTNRPAQTIHRLLKYNPEKGWGVNETKPLTCDYLLIDEVSMVSLDIMYRVLKGVDITRTKIIFVADSAQIPSIGLGNILHDLVQSKLFPVNQLTKVFRYGGGGLDMVATKVRKGESWFEDDVKTPMIFGDDQDFVFVPYNKSKGLKTLLKTYKSLLKKHDVSDIMVTMIYNKGSYGTVRVNKLLQEIYNPPKKGLKEIEFGDTTFREGDKIINIENDYKAKILHRKPDKNMRDSDIEFNTVGKDQAIYNGDIGVIEKVMDKHIIIHVDDKYYVYTKTKLKKLSLGYCLSTHKSQGSESDYVLMFMPSNHAYMLNRNLFYVAMTRAKKKTIAIGSPKTIKKAMYKAEQFNRMTNLNNIINAYKTK